MFVQSASLASAQAEGESLRDKVRSLETKASRLKDVFKSKIQQFRETIAILTGWKVEMVPSTPTTYVQRKACARRMNGTDWWGLVD